MPKIFNNKTEKVGDELKKDIKSGSKIDVAAAIFSMYGFEVLKKELSGIDQRRRESVSSEKSFILLLFGYICYVCYLEGTR